MCDCILDINKELAAHNALLVTTMVSTPHRVVVEVQKLDDKKRGRLPVMLATYCPFCGERYYPKGSAIAAGTPPAAPDRPR